MGKIDDQVGVFRRLELDPDEFIRLVPQAQDEMIAKTIAAGVIPG
jgi:electron transfer flavoprotein alpha subunit